MATERLTIVIEERGARAVGRLIEDIGVAAKQSIGGVTQLAKSLGRLSTSRIGSGGIDTFSKKLSSLVSRIDPVTAATRRFANDTRLLDQALNTGSISLSRHEKLTALLENSYQRLLNPLQNATQKLQQEISLLRKSGAARSRASELLRVETGLRRRGVLVNERQRQSLRALINEKQKLASTANKTTGSVLGLSRALGLLGGVFALRTIARSADIFTNLQNRLKLVTNSTKELNATTEELFRIASTTRVGIGQIAETFTRTALAVDGLGISSQRTLEFTDTLAKTVALSGATADEARGALVQLSQGLARGVIRGQEFLSVAEQLPAILDVVARSLGTTKAEITNLAQAGGLTSKLLIRAFRDQSESVADDFRKNIPTIGQAIETVKTSFAKFLGEVNKATGIFNTLAKVVKSVGDNIALIAGAGLFLGLLVAIKAATVAAVAFNIALKANPILLLASTAVAVGTALFVVSDAFESNADKAAILRKELESLQRAQRGQQLESTGFTRDTDEIIARFEQAERLGLSASKLSGEIDNVRKKIRELVGPSLFTRFFESGVKLGERLIEGINAGVVQQQIDLATGVTLGLAAFARFDPTEGIRKAREKKAAASAKKFRSDLEGLVRSLDPVEAAFREEAEAIKLVDRAFRALEKGHLAGIVTREQLVAIEAKIAAQREAAADPIGQVTKALKAENELLKLNADARERKIKIQEIATNLDERGLSAEEALVAAKSKDIQALLDQNDALVKRNAQLKEGKALIESLLTPQEKYDAELLRLDILLKSTAINQDFFNRAVARAKKELEGTSFLDKLQGQFQDLDDILQNQLISAIDGVSQAFTDLVTKGKADFEELARSIVASITKIIIQQLLLRTIAGGIVAATGGSFLKGFQGAQHGASFNVGGQGGPDSQLVAFRASPNERVDVLTPAQQQVQAAPAEVNIRNINVSNDREASAAFLESEEGETVILNVINRNRSSLGIGG